MEDSSPTPVCRSSCLSEVAFGFFLLVIVLLFVLPVGLFYGWWNPDVNEWYKEKAFSTVLEYIENCTSHTYETYNNSEVSISLLWNNMWSDCQSFSDEKLESPPVTIAINETRLVHISHQSTKGSLFFNIQTDSLVGQNNSICNESASVYSFCQRLSHFFLNRDGTGATKITVKTPKTVNIDKVGINWNWSNMTLPVRCINNVTAIGKLLHYLRDKGGTFATSGKEMSGQPTHSYSSVNDSGNGSTECTSQYMDMCGVCVPKCSSFSYNLSPTNNDRSYLQDILVTVCVVSILGGMVFIVLALIRRDEMLTFPSVLVLYETIHEMAIAIIVLIPQTGTQRLLFCSHDDVIRSMYSDPTPFCSFSGVVFQFALVSTFIYWIVHILYIGVLVKFPFFGKKLQKKSKQIHIATVLAAIFLASIGPVVTLVHVGYFTAQFPVTACFPRNMDVLFFSVSLPLIVLVGLGTVILVFLFRELRKTFNSKIERQRRSLSPSHTNVVGTAERKVLFIAIAFIILGALLLTRFSQNFGDQYAYIQRLAEYPNCQLQARENGHVRCSMPQENPNIYKVVYDTCALFLFATLPYINWIFPLKPSDFKKLKNGIVLPLLTAKRKLVPDMTAEQVDFV